MNLTKSFDWDMEKEYPVLETITEQEFFDKYPNIIGIGCHYGKTCIERGDRGIDIVAFMNLGDFYRNMPPKKFYNKFMVLGGMGIPALIPLQVYGHTTYNHNMGFYFVNTSIEITRTKSTFTRQLLDTGASYCHITYPMWIDMGLRDKFFAENKELCKLYGFHKPSDFDFENLPMTKISLGESTSLGDGSVVTAYPIRIDKLTLNSQGNTPVEIDNITARLINSLRAQFIIGENVIKYLDIVSKPVNGQFTLHIDFSYEGKQLMDKHRKEQNINNMQTCYLLASEFRESE